MREKEFLTLDQVYQKQVKLVVTSTVSLDRLFTDVQNKSTHDLLLMHQCLSRLILVQTRSYLRLPHLSQ